MLIIILFFLTKKSIKKYKLKEDERWKEDDRQTHDDDHQAHDEDHQAHDDDHQAHDLQQTIELERLK